VRSISPRSRTPSASARTEGALRGPSWRAHQGFRPCCRRRLSNRYISDRFLPDKAIDLVDEAAAQLKTEIDSIPTELDEVNPRRVMQREIEETALKNEKDFGLKERLETLAERTGRSQGPGGHAARPVATEKRGCATAAQFARGHRENKADIEQAEQKRHAARPVDMAEIGRCATAPLPALEAKLKDEEQKLSQKQGESRLLKRKLTRRISPPWSVAGQGVPVSRLLSGEVQKIAHPGRRTGTSASSARTRL